MKTELIEKTKQLSSKLAEVNAILFGLTELDPNIFVNMTEQSVFEYEFKECHIGLRPVMNKLIEIHNDLGGNK